MQAEQIATVRKHRQTHTTHAHIRTPYTYIHHTHIFLQSKSSSNSGEEKKHLMKWLTFLFQQRFPEGFESTEKRAAPKKRKGGEGKEEGGMCFHFRDVFFFSSSSLQQRNDFKDPTTIEFQKEDFIIQTLMSPKEKKKTPLNPERRYSIIQTPLSPKNQIQIIQTPLSPKKKDSINQASLSPKKREIQ